MPKVILCQRFVERVGEIANPSQRVGIHIHPITNDKMLTIRYLHVPSLWEIENFRTILIPSLLPIAQVDIVAIPTISSLLEVDPRKIVNQFPRVNFLVSKKLVVSLVA